MSLGLYVHVPFCIKKCAYCDFVSFPLSADKVELYIDSLTKEMQFYTVKYGDISVDSLFIGGGTPSCLSNEQLCHIIQNLREYFSCNSNWEATVEVNPGTVTVDKLTALRRLGVNRLSIGVQAFQSELLKTMGRIHSVQMAKEAIMMARQAGFNNLSLDLMFALPGQTLVQWQETLQQAVDLAPEHLSCYSLKVEAGTPFATLLASGELPKGDEDLELAMYRWTVEFLRQQGYGQYEISNFARPGYRCQHNLKYWRSKDYLGLGPAAHSCVTDRRWFNYGDLSTYAKSVAEAGNSVEDVEKRDQDLMIKEYVIMALRLVEGIYLADFHSRFGTAFEDLFQKEIQTLLELQMLEKAEGRVFLTEQAFPVANLVLEKFV